MVNKKHKGNPRVSGKSAAALESPGDPNHPATFISCHEREGKTAAYVGYANTEDLRRIVLCWPVLLAVVQINRNPKYTNGSGAFKLLNDDLESYKDIDDAAAAFPLTSGEARQKTAANKRLAAILSKMIQDFALMSTLDLKDNKARQKAAMVSYKQDFPDRANVPLLVVSMCRGPTLGPREDEHDLEAHNRCFMLTKYFKYCHQLKIEAFQNRFPADGNFKGSKVPLNMVPAWMRPKPKTADPESSKSEAMQRADSLSKKTFTLCYLPRLNNPDSRDDVEENFDKAAGDGVEPLDSNPQDFWIDPRLYDSLPSLRDQIRRQLRCHIFRTNLHTVVMKYKQKEADGIFDMSADLLNGDWTVIKPILHDEANDGFNVQVGLWARDYESTQNIFEEFDVPPHLRAYFKPVGVGLSRDITTDLAGIQANAQRVFGPVEDTDEAANIDPGERILAYLDTGLSLGAGPNDIGEAPNPMLRFQGDKEAMLTYYDGLDVTSPDELRKWQMSTLRQCSMLAQTSYSADKPARPSAMTKSQKAAIGGKLTDVQRAAIEESSFLGSTAAQGREDVDKGDERDPEIAVSEADDAAEVTRKRRIAREREESYYTMRKGYSGTEKQAGPPLDLCLRLLLCEEVQDQELGTLWKSKVLRGVTTSNFFHYQISGAVGACLKLYGHIDVDKLLKYCEHVTEEEIVIMREAAAQLRSLCLNGCILADDVGFGKTKQLLLAAFLHMVMSEETDGKGNFIYRPILLVVPPTLIDSWIKEIRSSWEGLFRLVVSYEDHDYKEVLKETSLTASMLSQYPEGIPDELAWLFDKSNPQAARGLVLTSYETHKSRTGIKTVEITPAKSYDPKMFGNDDKEIFETPSRLKTIWTTNLEDAWGLLLADEAQKVKNPHSANSIVLFKQKIPKVILATATPFHNTVKDLLGLLQLMWYGAKTELHKYLAANPDRAPLLQAWRAKSQIYEELDKLDPTDSLRLRAVDPQLLTPVVSKGPIHIQVVSKLKCVLETTMIRRSASSNLPNSTGQSTPLRPLFKKIHRRTARVSRRPNDEYEYQLFHRVAADEFVDAIKRPRKEDDRPLPDHNSAVAQQPPFAFPVVPLRRMAIANFSTKMARLNASLEAVGSNTHVETLQKWRERGLEGEAMVSLTRGEGEPEPKTASDIAKYLTRGSPAVALAMTELLDVHAFDPLNPDLHQHQKLIIGEATPANAYYLQAALRACLVDARILHAGLSNKAKSRLVDQFNDPKSQLKCLIMMYDVGAVGLNLHIACNRVFIASVGRSFALEEQLCGRALRESTFVTSRFPLTVTRRWTPNSHDQFRGSLQADKATIQLAANAHDPEIRQLVVKLLNAQQPEVDHLRNSAEGKRILEDVNAYLKMKKELGKAAAKSVQLEESTFNLRPRGSKAQAEMTPCDICEDYVPVESECTCNKCGTLGHPSCLGLDEPATDFVCKRCVEQGKIGDIADLGIGEGKAWVGHVEDDDDGSYEETEDLAMLQSGRTLPQQRAEELLYDDFNTLLGNQDLNDFASDTQPSDDVRHNLVLLSLPVDHTWTDADLGDENHLRIGLLLLFNLIQGQDRLATSRSPHIHYSQFPERIRDQVKNRLVVTDATRTDLINAATP